MSLFSLVPIDSCSSTDPALVVLWNATDDRDGEVANWKVLANGAVAAAAVQSNQIGRAHV